MVGESLFLGNSSMAKNLEILAPSVQLWQYRGELWQRGRKFWQLTGGEGKHVSYGAQACGNFWYLGDLILGDPGEQDCAVLN